MNFIRFDNCVVADLSLQKYCEVNSTPVVSLVFMKDFKSLPLVGFSVCSARKIIMNKLHPNQTIAYKEWKSPRLPEWARGPVRRNDYLRIMLQFEEKRLRVRYRFNMSPPTECIYFDYLPTSSRDTYLALSSYEMFDEPGKSLIAVLSLSEMLAWTTSRKEQREAKAAKEKEKSLVSSAADAMVPAPPVEALLAGPPMCTWCWENPIDSLLMPCNHAVCCKMCKEKYINNERDKMKLTLSGPAEVVCPVCRKKIENVARIWFPEDGRCLFCESDCGIMSAVAGGRGGCGCVIGCYAKAKKSCERGGFCPSCGVKLVEILQIFVQGDRDR